MIIKGVRNPMFILISVFISFIGTHSFHRMQETSYQPIENALLEEDAEALSLLFAPQLELTIKDNADFAIRSSYSSKDGKQVLTNFFEQYEVSDFEVSHVGTSHEINYIIGFLDTDKGKFRVLIRYGLNEEKIEINEIEFVL